MIAKGFCCSLLLENTPSKIFAGVRDTSLEYIGNCHYVIPVFSRQLFLVPDKSLFLYILRNSSLLRQSCEYKLNSL